jgi:hypothetical protein
MKTRREGIQTRSRLGQLARRGASSPAATQAASEEERCELCGLPIDPGHRHLLDLRNRELMCACRACSTLFDSGAAGGGHFKLVPDRILRLEGFELDDLAWANLRIPVDIAFFFRSGEGERTQAYYPSPMGPTESHLGLEAWSEIEAANPVLASMADDVEALLVDRARGERRQWLVPIEECYGLVGLIRVQWKGLSGGSEVWEAIDGFFASLDRRARPPRASELQQQASAGAPTPAGGS